MILVCGLDYSGTSATAGLLYHLGVHMGNVRQDVPALDEPAQALTIAAGGKPRHYLTYEDEDFNAMIYQALATPLLASPEAMTLHVWKALNHYAHERNKEEGPVGVKNNWACMLGFIDAWYGETLGVSHLIMTTRDPDEQRQSRKQYLPPGMHPLVQRFSAWLEEGYSSLLPYATMIVPFATLMTDPASIVDQLVGYCALQPSEAQRTHAIASIQRR